MEVKLEKALNGPNGKAAELLLRLWCTLRIDAALPLIIFDPKLLVNLRPSRLDLKSELSIVESPADLKAAVEALVQSGIAVQFDNGHETTIRLSDEATREDWALLNNKFLPNDGADGSMDDFLSEVAVFMFCVSPQSGVGVCMGTLFEQLFLHVRRLAHLLLQRYYSSNCLSKLKQLLLSDHFCFFLVTLQDRGTSTLPPRVDWLKPLLKAEDAEDLAATKTFIENEYGLEAVKKNPRLQFHWEGQLITSQLEGQDTKGYDQFLQLTERYRLEGHNPVLDCGELAAAELLRFGFAAAEDPPKPEAKTHLRKLLVGFENGEFVNSSAPAYYKRYLKAMSAMVIVNRLFEPAWKLLCRPIVDALHEMSKFTDAPLPHIHAALLQAQMFEHMAEKQDNIPVLVEHAMRSCNKLAKAIGARVAVIVELRSSLSPAIFNVSGMDGLESFLEEQVSIAAAQYGKLTDHYIAVLTDCAYCLSIQQTADRSPMQHRLCAEAVQQARATYPPGSRRLASVLCFATLLGDHTKDDYDPLAPEAVSICVKLGLWNDILFLTVLHTACRYTQYYKQDPQGAKDIIAPVVAHVEANKSTMIPSHAHLVSGMCTVLIDLTLEKDQEAVVERWNSIFELYKTPADESSLALVNACGSAVAMAVAALPRFRKSAVALCAAACNIVLEAYPKKYITDSDQILSDYFGTLQILDGLKEAQLALKLVNDCRAVLEQARPVDVARFDASIDGLLPNLAKKAAMQARAQSRKATRTGAAKPKVEESDDEEESEDEDDESEDDSDDEGSSSSEEDSNKFRRKNHSRRSNRRGGQSNTLLLVAVAGAAAAIGLVGAFVALKLMKKNSSK